MGNTYFCLNVNSACWSFTLNAFSCDLKINEISCFQLKFYVSSKYMSMPT